MQYVDRNCVVLFDPLTTITSRDAPSWRPQTSARTAKVALETAAMAAAGLFYLLVEDNRTSSLAGSTPPWGRPLRGLPADGDFHMTDWHAIAHLQPSQCLPTQEGWRNPLPVAA